MRVILLALIGTGVAFSQAPVPKPLPETFTQKYYEEVEKANKQLKVFTNTSCEASTFKDVEEQMETEYYSFKTLVKAIPDDEEPMVQVKEIEVFMGFQQILKDIVNDKDDCLKSINVPKGF